MSPGGLRAIARHAACMRVTEARGPLQRLVGLLGRRALDPDDALLLRTRSVHTWGMRFALDLVWLDATGSVVRVDRGVEPWSVRSCRAAHAVLECPAGQGERRASAYPQVLA